MGSHPVILGIKSHLGPKTRFLLLLVAVLSMWDPLSDETTALVICRGHMQQYMTSIFTILIVGILDPT
jgi:hypothetical protein